MTAEGSEPAEGGPRHTAAEPHDDSDRRELPTYQGSSVPLWLVVLYGAFIVWGLYYLVRWVPASWTEWFSAGGK